MSMKYDHIHWLGHDSVRIEGSLIVYIDPWEVSGPPAELVLITHDHYDHCDAQTVKKLAGAQTMLVANRSTIATLKSEGLACQFTEMKPGDEIVYKNANIKAVPSYNINKPYHPKEKNNLGFILSLDGLSIYHAGDTDLISEMKNIKAQVALLPISGTYTMTAEEAAEAAVLIGPELAIPMHFGKIVGDAAMAAAFAGALAGKIKVEIKSVEK